MPLANRVDPFGNLFAHSGRGLFMGNRGGRLHRDDRTLGARRWVSRRWICCRLNFKARRREGWGRGYTELFFLDEPTALAAGHRPCFECRRNEAQAFAAALASAGGHPSVLRASEIDDMLHGEPLAEPHRMRLDDLPDGVFLTLGNAPATAFAVRGPHLLCWTPMGYGERRQRSHATAADVLTPPAVVAALAGGYRPRWHPSADP